MRKMQSIEIIKKLQHGEVDGMLYLFKEIKEKAKTQSKIQRCRKTFYKCPRYFLNLFVYYNYIGITILE